MARKKPNKKQQQYDRDKIDPFSVPPAGYGLTTPPGKGLGNNHQNTLMLKMLMKK